jgi:prepilin-type N-terminal cleavage/methylation domain-containing protein
MSSRGFTLIETLITTGLIAIVSVTVATIMFVLLRSVSKAQSIKEVKESGEAALAVIEKSIHDGVDVDLNSCPAGQLSIEERNGDITSFYCDSGNQRIASNSAGGTMYITGDKVRCSSFSCSITPKGDNYLIELSFYLEPIGSYFEEGKIKFSSKVFLYKQN